MRSKGMSCSMRQNALVAVGPAQLMRIFENGSGRSLVKIASVVESRTTHARVSSPDPRAAALQRVPRRFHEGVATFTFGGTLSRRNCVAHVCV